jgi:Protein of unknown function (DUF1579)
MLGHPVRMPMLIVYLSENFHIMKNRIPYALLCIFFFAAFSFTVTAQSEAEMKAWQTYMTPGEMHKILATTDGEWTTDVKMWMDPKAEPMTSKGTCTNKMVLGGRYQESEFQGDFMGQKMEGKGITAYDNLKKQFESTWIDNMGSGIMKSTGTYDAGTKTFAFSGMQTDPMTGKDCAFRQTLQILDDNNHVMTMYTTPSGGKEYKTMEIKFARKK